MLTGTQAARVDEYLAALERALQGVEPDERAEVLLGVREHIDAALADRDEPTDADVDAVLRQLGDPLAIAAVTRAPGTRPAEPVQASRGPVEPVPVLGRDWVPTVVLLLVGLGSVFFFLAVPLLLWLAGLVLLWASPLWRTAEKVWGTLVPLGSVAAAIVLTTGSWSRSSQSCHGTGDGTAPVCTGSAPSSAASVLVWVGLAAAVIATVAALTVLWRRGTRRAPR